METIAQARLGVTPEARILRAEIPRRARVVVIEARSRDDPVTRKIRDTRRQVARLEARQCNGTGPKPPKGLGTEIKVITRGNGTGPKPPNGPGAKIKARQIRYVAAVNKTKRNQPPVLNQKLALHLRKELIPRHQTSSYLRQRPETRSA
jgi:hypothetical protein